MANESRLTRTEFVTHDAARGLLAVAVTIVSLLAPLTHGAIPAPAGLVITSPVEGTEVLSGQSLSVTVRVVSGTYPLGVALLGQGPLGAADFQPVVGSRAHFNLAIPADSSPDSYQLTAVAVDSTGAQVSSTPVTLMLETADLPTAVSIDPPAIFFAYIGQQLSWNLFASFAGGPQRDMTQSRHLSTVSQNPEVAIVEHGIITAMGSGRTTISVHYGKFDASISVTVPPFVRGDLNGDGRVDASDLNVILSWLHTPANGANDARDLNHDGMIDERDAEILKTLCTHPGCTSQ
jgi:hypothetical protein